MVVQFDGDLIANPDFLYLSDSSVTIIVSLSTSFDRGGD